MILINTLPSESARLIDFVGNGPFWPYGLSTLRMLSVRYGFLQYPTKIEEYNFGVGVRYRAGSFNQNMVDLELAATSIRAYSDAGTDVCDALIEDVVKAANESGAHITFGTLRAYRSVVEVQLEADFAGLFDRLTGVGELIGRAIERDGGPADPYRGAGVVLAGNLEKPGPEQFKLERRVGHPTDANIFFSLAPVRTEDHLEILTKLEAAIS